MKKMDPSRERYQRFLSQQIAEFEPLYNNLDMDVDHLYIRMLAKLEQYFCDPDYDCKDTYKLRDMLSDDSVITSPCNIVAMLFFDAALKLNETLFENAPIPTGESVAAILGITPGASIIIQDPAPRKPVVSVDGLGRPRKPRDREPAA